ncbi:primosomal protein N' [Clostridium botulinum]|uniref:primosomal protein N' n=1 Tax=unclassified Clostridium TaxID=2614128 RepID=UPI00050231C7|nr:MULTISPECIES: primosomal protein N' [unclassified Clostridium]AIY80213.1 primosomal protein N' [Clostridium botulinum 202F]KAI3348565.1 primosomal protein N' [Clostridium botulinum]KFX58247.1 primosome assembly protein PriA [Clostridium botulinum]KFX59140.1 primosome assembly protein PriA [Clostridium botulinum]KON12615.1 primosome assembly protein PriA [Clostridium botulinum]
MSIYAEIIINSDANEVDRPFTYKIPDEFMDKVGVGYRVKVPFGKGNRNVDGFIFRILTEELEFKYKIKCIVDVCEDYAILTKSDIDLINFLRNKYLCKYIDGIRLLIPVGIMKGLKNKKRHVIYTTKQLDDEKFKKDNYIKLYEFISQNEGSFTKSEITKENGFSSYSLNKLIEAGILKCEEQVVFRYNIKSYSEYASKTLTLEQQKAFDTIVNGNEKKYLIKGVTGSGKTEVYMHLVAEMLKQGKGCIILVPEIALTPQMIERFKGRFGSNISLFHSRLSDGERFDEWFRIKEGKSKLVIGARSALFLPMQNLGLIIIDEEHETTYKSEQNPKYNTIEVAEFITEMQGSKLILGSATPSIQSYYKSLKYEYKLIEMNKRVNKKDMPRFDIIDMREELKSNNLSLFSRTLYNEIDKNLKNKNQTILFLNRRGMSTFISCRSCGYVFKCPECDVSMTYHKNGYLICHYCGRAEREQKTCPKCKSKYVKYFGAGTERVETEVKKYFPKARVLRMDVDTTRHKNSHESIYNSFKNGEGDILIGTQMIAKGLDFPNVTLVGVLAADISINIPDYRCGERTFQIITQVAGRAGRGEKDGLVIVQTYTPNHYSLIHAKNADYKSFFEEEIRFRSLMDNPPFTKILVINGTSKFEEKLKNFMYNLQKELEKLIIGTELTLLGPVPCIITKLKDKYRWQIIIKGNLSDEFNKKVKDTLYLLNKSVYNEIRISIDINPNNMT